MRVRAFLLLLLLAGLASRLWQPPPPSASLTPTSSGARPPRSAAAARKVDLPGARQIAKGITEEGPALSEEEAAAIEPDARWKERKSRYHALFLEAQQGHRQPPPMPVRGRLPLEESKAADSVSFGPEDYVPWASTDNVANE